ncbi:autotransporter assembly complex family protein [Corticibacterium sp. UT-5YL-CI-8]|nr:autotransporter assembly complex family protein [Tianweitania sp. UT-5YL-CI-8]
MAFEIFGIRLWGSAEEETTDIVDPLRYAATLEVTGPDTEELTEVMTTASLLVSDQETPVSGSLGLLSRARSDRERLVAALFSKARYDGVVTIFIDGRDLDDLPPDAEFNGPQPISVSIRIDPGSRFVLGDIRLKGDAAKIMGADYGLISGGDASSDTILRAEARIVRALQEEGRPMAEITGREIVADHNTLTLDVTMDVAAGPIAGYGPTTVEGTEAVDRDFTAYMTGLPEGQTYSPEEVDDARDRLLALEVFNSVAVNKADELNAAGQIPMKVQVTERKQRYLGAGATVSNTDGLGLEGYWGHRNLFGRAEKLRIEGSISGIGSQDLGELNYNAGIMFEKPGVVGPNSKFFSNLKTVLEHPDAYDRFSVKGGVGLSYDLTKTQQVSAEFSLEYADVSDAFNPDGKEYLLASVPLQYQFDNRDDKLNPTTGWRALAYIEPTYDIENNKAFAKVRGEASTYYAIDEDAKYIIAGRINAGSVVGASIEDVPADRRFYAGGGGSVRGYAYQGIGPRNADGTPLGGLSLLEGSVEVRAQVTDTIGVVPFIDAGAVSEEQFPDFSNLKVGAGVGLRYLTPFGPLRVDVAMPLNPEPHDPDYGIYAGIGQSF